MSESDIFICYVNGRKIEDNNIDPEETLLQYLRKKLRLTGTKYGCGEGACGACTVMISNFNREKQKIEHFSANACLMSICSVFGKAVTTVEGIGSTRTFPHPVQERLATCYGSQCGYCTPGFVMSMYVLLRNNPLPAIKDIECTLQGNLCRCTGYRSILSGFRTFTSDFCCENPENCCPKTEDDEMCTKLYEDNFAAYDPTQEPIFPPELQLNNFFHKDTVQFVGSRVRWIRPVSFDQLVLLKSQYPRSLLIFGNTLRKINKQVLQQDNPIVLAPSEIKELKTINITDKEFTIGVGHSISNLQDFFRKKIQNAEVFQIHNYQMIVDYLNRFGGQQIRNVVSIGSSISSLSSSSDLNLLLVAVEASVDVFINGETVNVTALELLQEKKISDGHIITHVRIPILNQNEYLFCYKQSLRRFNDFSIINAGFKVLLDQNNDTVKSAHISYGGLSSNFMIARSTMNYLIGKSWLLINIDEALKTLYIDIDSIEDKTILTYYKCTLAASLFFKFYSSILTILQKEKPELMINKFEDLSSVSPLERRPFASAYSFPKIPGGQLSDDLVGRPSMHSSAIDHATGEANFTDDFPPMIGQLYLGLIKSTRNHAKILSVDPALALVVSGVVGYLNHTDFFNNSMGTGDDEEIFVSQEVLFLGQIIGVIVAEDEIIARRAAEMVIVQYEDLPAIIKIEEAIAANSYLCPPYKVNHGNVEDAFNSCDHIIEGEVYVGNQKHLYIEPMAVVVIPSGEQKEMDIIMTTQDPNKTQFFVSRALNIPHNRIKVKVKRIGGSYGAKSTAPNMIALPAALASLKFNRPVRYSMTREEDMTLVGTRHPYLFKYKVGVASNGKLLAIKTTAYSNGGYSLDFTKEIMQVTIIMGLSIYYCPNIDFIGYCLKTNLPSNLSFRGFGTPQATVLMETIMNNVAKTLNIGQAEVREINLYCPGLKTFWGQEMPDGTNVRCWNECIEKSDYYKRKSEVEIFNSNNKHKKRGIAIAPIMFGLNTIKWPKNWAAALVNIHFDGTVSVSHGGIEMGQGIHTKMLQIASRVLHLPISKIHIKDTDNNLVPNIGVDGGSINSDINGRAVQLACQTLLERLEPFINDNLKGTWEDWVKAAYYGRVNLSATGFFKSPYTGDHLTINENHAGMAYNSCIYGAGCYEVEIDCLTGDHQMLRCDLILDLGESLNPAIDIGQIEGGFLQAYGMVTLEQWKISDTGIVLTRGPGSYKIPTIYDIPSQFYLHFLKGVGNKDGLFSSKGPGECGLCFAGGILMSIKNAIYAARIDADINNDFQLDSPATAEKIRLSCDNKFNCKSPVKL